MSLALGLAHVVGASEKRTPLRTTTFFAGLSLSTTRSSNAVRIFGFLALAGLGLGWLSRHEAEPDLRVPAAQSIPVGAEIVATIDVAKLESSSLGALEKTLVDRFAGPKRDEVKRLCGFDPLSKIIELAIAVPGAPLDGELGVAATGDLDADRIATCAAKVIEARGGRPIRLAEDDFLLVGDPASSGVLAVKSGGPLLLGGASYVRQMMAASGKHAPSALVDARHMALRHEAGENAPLVISALLTSDSRERIRHELAGTHAPATSVIGLAASLSPSNEVELHAVVGCDRTEPCAELATSLREAADKDGAPLARLLSRLVITSEGATLHGRAKLSPAEIAGLVLALFG